MRIVKANAGALTNFEVLDFLNSRGASKDTTRVIAPIARSEYKVYDYLVETAASTQTRESVTKFADKCKDFKVAKAEILNIINLRPSSIVELLPIIETPDDREIDTDGILELVKDLLDVATSLCSLIRPYSIFIFILVGLYYLLWDL